MRRIGQWPASIPITLLACMQLMFGCVAVAYKCNAMTVMVKGLYNTWVRVCRGIRTDAGEWESNTTQCVLGDRHPEVSLAQPGEGRAWWSHAGCIGCHIRLFCVSVAGCLKRSSIS